jgi:hypothetical protein
MGEQTSAHSLGIETPVCHDLFHGRAESVATIRQTMEPFRKEGGSKRILKGAIFGLSGIEGLNVV